MRVHGWVVVLSDAMPIEGRRAAPERKRNESKTSSCTCIA